MSRSASFLTASLLVIWGGRDPIAYASSGAVDVFTAPVTVEEAGKLLSDVVHTGSQSPGMTGHFKQQKTLRELPHPLQSSGDFFVARGLGINWHTHQPFDSELILTRDQLSQRTGDGSFSRTDAAMQPGLRAVSDVFNALFAVDLQRLSATFDIYGLAVSQGHETWILGLRPRDQALSKVIVDIVISGGKQPNHIVLHEAGGDATEIDFTDIQLIAVLSAQHRAQFSP